MAAIDLADILRTRIPELVGAVLAHTKGGLEAIALVQASNQESLRVTRLLAGDVSGHNDLSVGGGGIDTSQENKLVELQVPPVSS